MTKEMMTENASFGKEYEAKGDVGSPEPFVYVSSDSSRGVLVTGTRLFEFETGLNYGNPTVLALPDGSVVGIWHHYPREEFHWASFPFTNPLEMLTLSGMNVKPWTSFRRTQHGHLVLIQGSDYAYDLTDKKKLELGWCNCGISVVSEDASQLYSITDSFSVMPIVDNKLGDPTIITDKLDVPGELVAVGLGKGSICLLKTSSYDNLTKVNDLKIYKVSLGNGEVTSQGLSDIPANKRCVALSRACNVYVAFDSKSTGLSVGNALDVAYAGLDSPSFKTIARGIFRSGISNEHSWSSDSNRCVVLE